MIPVLIRLVEDPESSKAIEPFEEGHLLRRHRGGRNSLFQFQQAPIIDPPEQRKKITPEQSFFFKSKTAVEVDEERLSFFRDQNVSFMPQVQMDHTPVVNLPEHSFQGREKRKRKGLSSQNGSSRNEFHGEGETVNPLDRLGNAFYPGEQGIDLPFFMNEPEPQGPPQKKLLSSDILHHQGSTFYLYLIQVGFPEIPLGKAD